MTWLRLHWALALLILISSLLIMAGLALFIFPGVWIMINLVFAEYLLVLRGRPVVQSMRDSASMTTGHFMRIMICVVGVLAPIWLIDGLLLMAFPEPSPGMELAMDSLSLGESPLTERETDVLRAAADGAAVATIAGRVHLSPGTVRNHLSAAIGKTGAGNRSEAVQIATANGWL